MSTAMPQLSMLQAFEAAGRLGSLKAAAEELNLTPSAISHRISALESRLDIALFEPKGRGLSLTHAGKTYLAGVRSGLDQISIAGDQIRHQGLSGPLKIRLYPTFAHRWLIPRLESFTSRYPDIEMDLVITTSPFDFSSSDTDIAIEYTKRPIDNYECVKLLSEEVVAICSEQFHIASGRPTDPNALNNLNRIHNLLHPEEWDWWREKAGVKGNFSARDHRVNSRDTAIDAAAAGLGVALARHPLIDEELTTRRVIAPFGVSASDSKSYYFISTPERLSIARVSAFRDWIVSQSKRG
ncbi:LysR family transcriptional regulator, glycine cleavage system transcriptional activator [Shimia gijangensis]|uniref:LysR family transcriptional regulator, glycine cleavage system transcriptional activator n=1 Tax=Shimia gijangensis TaxID=1470563 RepID=A0A1M6N2I8_9RHOB|nr:LysR substrate-binding domain-containing protein [Shimia gijangensis]SHJ89793.1 LysR family transcriptional regulator, glycine cleavage system transcriptional activator [Shimia gijangensis]